MTTLPSACRSPWRGFSETPALRVVATPLAPNAGSGSPLVSSWMTARSRSVRAASPLSSPLEAVMTILSPRSSRPYAWSPLIVLPAPTPLDRSMRLTPPAPNVPSIVPLALKRAT